MIYILGTQILIKKFKKHIFKDTNINTTFFVDLNTGFNTPNLGDKNMSTTVAN